MAGPDQDEDKQLDPTSKKLEDARKKGDIAKSQEVNTAVAATGCVLAFGAFVSVVFGAGFRGRRRDGQGADDKPEGASAD